MKKNGARRPSRPSPRNRTRGKSKAYILPEIQIKIKKQDSQTSYASPLTPRFDSYSSMENMEWTGRTDE